MKIKRDILLQLFKNILSKKAQFISGPFTSMMFEIIERQKNKLNYIYILTPKGVSATTKLTLNFMKRKMKEYDELKKEIDS